mgnify:CR=1 FL=1
MSRVKAKILTDLLYNILNHSDPMPNQHGYRQDRGIHTAIKQIAMRTKEPFYAAYEFDLTKFFNKVAWERVKYVIAKRSSRLSKLMEKVIFDIRYKLPAGQVEDGELREVPVEERLLTDSTRRRVITRQGLPQGLSFSPILATQTMELVETNLE